MTQELMQKMTDRYKFMRDHMSADDADILYAMESSQWDEYIDARIEEVKADGTWK